jgi:ferredoxin
MPTEISYFNKNIDKKYLHRYLLYLSCNTRYMRSSYKISVVGRSTRYECEVGDNLLAALASAGCCIPTGCRNGGCGVCKVQILEGAFERGKMSAACVDQSSATAGFVLACRTFPTSDLVVTLAPRGTSESNKSVEI